MVKKVKVGRSSGKKPRTDKPAKRKRKRKSRPKSKHKPLSVLPTQENTKDGRENADLIRRALINHWPVPDAVIGSINRRLTKLSEDKRISAAKALEIGKFYLRAIEVNSRVEAREDDTGSDTIVNLIGQQNIQQNVTVQAVINQLSKDPAWEAAAAAEMDREAAAIKAQRSVNDNGNGKSKTNGKPKK